MLLKQHLLEFHDLINLSLVSIEVIVPSCHLSHRPQSPTLHLCFLFPILHSHHMSPIPIPSSPSHLHSYSHSIEK